MFQIYPMKISGNHSLSSTLLFTRGFHSQALCSPSTGIPERSNRYFNATTFWSNASLLYNGECILAAASAMAKAPTSSKRSAKTCKFYRRNDLIGRWALEREYRSWFLYFGIRAPHIYRRWMGLRYMRTQRFHLFRRERQSSWIAADFLKEY